MRKHELLKIIAAGSMITGACSMVAAILYDIRTVFVRRYEVRTDKVAQDVRICFLSDLHGFEHGEDNAALIEKIDRLHPNLILVGGDMLTADETSEKNSQHRTARIAYKLLTNLASRYPVYATSGNHEQEVRHMQAEGDMFYSHYVAALADAGVIFLHNQSIHLDEYNIELTGAEISRRYFGHFYKRPMPLKYLYEKLGEPMKDRFTLLMAHNPLYFEEYGAWGADLTLSGHVHGGIIRLPLLGGVISPALILFPRYDGGRFRNGRRQMILSRGLGTHTIPVRLFNPCELVVVDLVRK